MNKKNKCYEVTLPNINYRGLISAEEGLKCYTTARNPEPALRNVLIKKLGKQNRAFALTLYNEFLERPGLGEIVKEVLPRKRKSYPTQSENKKTTNAMIQGRLF